MERTPLPGIGVRYDVMTDSGRRVGIVSRRDGKRELVLASRDDPDGCAASVPLTSDEAHLLAEILNGERD